MKNIKKLKSNTIVKTSLTNEFVVLKRGKTVKTIKQLENELNGFDYDEKVLIVPNIIYGANFYTSLKGARTQNDYDLSAQGVVLHSQIKKVIK